MAEEQKNEVAYPTTPDIDSQMKVEDVNSLDFNTARKKLAALKKSLRDLDKKITKLETKNPAFSLAYQEKEVYERNEKELNEIKGKENAQLELDRKQVAFEAARASYDRTFNKFDDSAKINFTEYCRLTDTKKHTKALIAALEKRTQTRKSSKSKVLSVLSCFLILAAVAGYCVVKDKEAKKNSPKVEQTTHQSGDQTEGAQNPQVAQPEQVDAKTQEAITKFNTAIAKYPQKTQEAMRMGIEWLKKYNAFTKARATKDNVARMRSSLEMEAYQSAIQQLDNNVWVVINDRMGPDFVAQDKENPGMTFDLTPVYLLLPETYDALVGGRGQNQGQAQVQTQTENTPKPEFIEAARSNPATVGGDYNKAIAYSVQMLHKMDLFFTMHSINPNDGVLLSLNREMSELGQKIEQAQPALYAYIAQESRQLTENYTKTGVRPTISIDRYQQQLQAIATELRANPQKAINLYAMLLQHRSEEQSKQNNPPVQRQREGGR